ncbi:MAG: M20/M25/M40 family metallo-hydrolase [Candidatus Lokiarchaeota archaeon]|nr:M20/M25/M40 family metallo-hydrolase [Candidatus Lokiarchaeota archaeon]
MPKIKENKSEADFMLNFIKDICDDIGPRPSYSEKEKQGADYMLNKYKKYSEDVHSEDFIERAAPTMIDFKLAAVFYFVSVILYAFIPILSFILMIFALIAILLEQIWNIRILNLFGPEKRSQNVIAKLKPKEKAKKIIIFGNHIDSAYELVLIRKLQQKFIILIGGALLFLILLPIFSLIKFILSGFQFIAVTIDVVYFISLIGIPFTLPLFFFVSNRPVHGANDNLSATAICLNLLKKLSKDPPLHTELWFISFGAEEVGRKGSINFVKHHKKELENTYTINIETVGGKGRLAVLEQEVTVTHSSEVVNLLMDAASAIGKKLEPYKIPVAGGTDSWAFSKNGFKASAITCLSETTIPEGWHCREDKPDIINKEKLKIVSDICESFIRIIDNQDL